MSASSAVRAAPTRRRLAPRALPRTRVRGVGLIEILIAVVVVSIGFLAAARMQVSSMRSSQNAYYRSQAHFMASEMIDRMRANVAGVRDERYRTLVTAGDAADPGCETKSCTSAEIARQDLHDWSAYLHAFGRTTGFTPLLPSVDGVDASGSVTEGSDGRYTIRLTWGEIVDGESAAAELRVDFVPES